MINIVIPMAGAGSRFATAGYIEPKPLILIHGLPMIRLVIENLRPKRTAHRFIFLAQRAHLDHYGMREKLISWAGPNAVVMSLDGLTEGAACTVLLAKSLIATQEPLMIANCDQYVDVAIDDYLDHINGTELNGLIMTMTAKDPKWSFVGLDRTNRVTVVVEKKVISNEATVGIYNFAHGSDFVRAAEAMIEKNLRVNNEFYVAPSYNEMIQSETRGGSKVGIFNIGSDGHGMYGLGVPEDLQRFLGLPVSHSATRGFSL
jgi:dTDP-glucose pyrophosphorylase